MAINFLEKDKTKNQETPSTPVAAKAVSKEQTKTTTRTRPKKPDRVLKGQEALVDRYLELKKLISDSGWEEELEGIKKALMDAEGVIKEVPAEESCCLLGTAGSVFISQKKEVRQVTGYGPILGMLGTELFMEVVSIKLKDLDKYLTKKQLTQVVTKTRSGSRSLTVQEPDAAG